MVPHAYSRKGVYLQGTAKFLMAIFAVNLQPAQINHFGDVFRSEQHLKNYKLHRFLASAGQRI